jgi:uncharacterized repeat protein (TIGR01451 family)
MAAHARFALFTSLSLVTVSIFWGCGSSSSSNQDAAVGSAKMDSALGASSDLPSGTAHDSSPAMDGPPGVSSDLLPSSGYDSSPVLDSSAATDLSHPGTDVLLSPDVGTVDVGSGASKDVALGDLPSRDLPSADAPSTSDLPSNGLVDSSGAPDSPAGYDGPTVTGTGGAGAGGSGGAAGAIGSDAGPQPSALTFDVSTTADPVAPGGRLLYTITVGNTSNVAIAGVTVTWLLPTGVQFNYANDSEPNSSCAGSVTCSANGQATWTLGALAAGASRTITVNVLVLTSLGSGDSIAASFKLTATGVNPVTFNKTVQVYTGSSAQLSTGTAINPATPGQKLTLDLDIGQLGTNALTNAVLQASLAPGLTVASIGQGGTQASPGVVTWNIGGLGVGAALHRTVDITVDSNVPAGAILTTRATLTYDGGLAVDAAAEYAIRVASAAPFLSLVVAATTSPVVPGGRILYTATISNLSSRSVDGISLLLRVPVGLQMNYSNDAAPDSNCAGSVTCSAGLEALWSLGTLAAGDSRPVTLNPQVLANTLGNGNLVRALFALSGTGVDEIDAVKTVQIYDSPAAQLAFGATANPVIATQAFTYNFDIGQIGLNALTNAQLRATLPHGVTVGTISGGGAQDASGDVVWNLGTVAVGADQHLTVNVTGDGTAPPGTILDGRAALTYDGGAEIDAVTDYAIPVVAAPQGMTLTVTAAPNPAVPGNRLLYTATVTNTTSRSVDSVQLYLRVPVGLQFNYANDADPNSSCAGSVTCSSGFEAVWALGTMAAGAIQIVTLNAQVLTSLLGGSLIADTFWLSATGLDAPILVPLVIPAN